MTSYRKKLHASYIDYRAPRDAHADILLLFLKLEDLGDRVEARLSKIIKSFISGKFHPTIPLFVDVRTDKTLTTCQSRTTLGSRRPSVFGTTLYNQHLEISTDTEDTDT